ncbi:MAG: ParB N-terminal domain-containing protein [Acidobacteriia bacterium]|nr:ParB N-terminal domain-containing protein [Terriglobia bacterium]
MKIEQWSVSRVIPYKRNPRRNEDAVEKVARSIKEFGFKQPIVVDKDDVIIVGHTRLLAALRLGMKEVPVLVARDLSPSQVKAYRLADNRVHEEAEWDEELLALELGDLSKLGFNLEVTGFDADEINELLNLEQGGLLPGAEEDAIPATPAKPATFPGELIQLGKHRLICGDSTDPFVIEKLFSGAKADAVFTDPPYNVNYEGGAGKIKNDNMGDEEFRAFALRAFALMFRMLKDGAPIYVCHADIEGLNFRGAFKEAGFKLAGCLIWCKDSLVLGRSDYQWQHEPILYGWKPTGSHKWYGDRKSTTIAEFMLEAPLTQIEPNLYRLRLGDQWFQIRGEKITIDELETTVIKIPKHKKNEDHPTMKPVALIDKMLRNSTKKNDLVFDPFGGSGSTLISCEKLGRTAYLCELEPKFCDVIVLRWEQVTGKKAKREARQ